MLIIIRKVLSIYNKRRRGVLVVEAGSKVLEILTSDSLVTRAVGGARRLFSDCRGHARPLRYVSAISPRK